MNEINTTSAGAMGQGVTTSAPTQAMENPNKNKASGQELSSPFILRPDGLYYQGENDPEKVCSPINVRAMTRDAEGRNWGRLVEVTDSDGKGHRWAMPMEMVAGNDYLRELLSMGLRLKSGQWARFRLHDFLNTAAPEVRACCVSRVGWHGCRFVLPDAVFGPLEGEEVILQGGPTDHAFQVAGSLQDWQEAIGKYCAGNSRLTMAVSVAFAAPMLAPTGMESGGFHLFGGSSTGKTTALRVGGSACGGGGLNGYLRQWRTTDNALESIATGSCDCLLTLDELGQADAKTAGEVAYMLTNGQGKSRAKRDGTARKPHEWRTLFLSTGEITLGDKIRENGQGRVMAGQAVRVVDIQADAGEGLGLFEYLHGFDSPHAFARHLAEASGKYYGSPLRAFLEKLTEHSDKVIREAPAFFKEFVDKLCPPNADGQVRRVASRFALAAYAGELGIEWGILPWDEGDAWEALATCFEDWMRNRGGGGAAEVTAGLAQVRAFFQAHGSSRFETWGDADTSKVNNRAGFRRKNVEDEWEYYVPPAVFKAEIARGYDEKRLVKELVERGLIIPGKDRKPAATCRIPGHPVMKCYRFSSKILGEDL